jgi:hypothetical protein
MYLYHGLKCYIIKRAINVKLNYFVISETLITKAENKDVTGFRRVG